MFINNKYYYYYKFRKKDYIFIFIRYQTMNVEEMRKNFLKEILFNK